MCHTYPGTHKGLQAGEQRTSVASSLGFMSVHVSAGITHSPGDALHSQMPQPTCKGDLGRKILVLAPPP